MQTNKINDANQEICFFTVNFNNWISHYHWNYLNHFENFVRELNLFEKSTKKQGFGARKHYKKKLTHSLERQWILQHTHSKLLLHHEKSLHEKVVPSYIIWLMVIIRLFFWSCYGRLKFFNPVVNAFCLLFLPFFWSESFQNFLLKKKTTLFGLSKV